MFRALLLVLIAGCGFRIPGGASSGDGGADAAGDGAQGDGPNDPPSDATTDGPAEGACILAWLNHTVSFGMPLPIAELSSTSFDRDPFLSADELTIWYSNGGAQSQGGGDVFKATRASLTAAFGTPARDASFSSSDGVESKMSMTDSRTFAVVASTKGGGAGLSDLWQTSRANTSASWGPLMRTQVMALDTAANELDPFVTGDGLQLYYSPVTPAPQHIVVAKRATTSDSFGNVADVTPLNTTGDNFDPMLIAGGRVIVFASSRPGSQASDNIWYATRPTASDQFGVPVELTSVSSNFDDGDPHVSTDGCRIYFSRRVGGGVDWELYSAAIP